MVFWSAMELCSTEREIVKLFECLELKKCKIAKKFACFQAQAVRFHSRLLENHYTGVVVKSNLPPLVVVKSFYHTKVAKMAKNE